MIIVINATSLYYYDVLIMPKLKLTDELILELNLYKVNLSMLVECCWVFGLNIDICRLNLLL